MAGGKLENPLRMKNFDRNAEMEIKKAFDFSANEDLLVAVFCNDDSYKERIEMWAGEAKSRRFYTAFLYLTQKDVKTERDLFERIINALEGDTEEITGDIESEKGSEMDVQFDGIVNPIREYLFNPIGSTNPERKFLSTARPVSSDNFIRGDGNCGFRAISYYITGNFLENVTLKFL